MAYQLITQRSSRVAGVTDGGQSLLRDLTQSGFSGCLEDHATPDFDGVVGEAFIKSP
jgi:hypothetical protein